MVNKTYLKICLILLTSILVLLPFILAINLAKISGFKDSHQTTDMILRQNPNSSGENIEKTFSSKSYIKSADVDLKVDVIWPLPGYYYVTDFLELSVYTNKIANCTYDFSSSIHGMYENGTDHWDYIYNLADNMEGDPYEILFECTDSINTGYNDTWFWINNTSYLDRYLLREGIGSYEYVGADLSWEGNDNGFLQLYDAIYKKNSTRTLVQFLVFDDAGSVLDFISNEVMPEIEDNYSIIVINKSNMYFSQESKDKYYIWNSKNFLISMVVYSLTNSSVDAPLEIINAYLEKYPSDLRNGICGDGKVDILNNDGFKEECDKNSQERLCGSNIGECRKGKETRVCNQNCTWAQWSKCNATSPKKEICDNKDNNCDGKIDEDFLNLGKNCSAGTGGCFRQGNYICSENKSTTKCSVNQGQPSKENCTDNIDNDCDGLTDFNDTLDCIFFKLFSPLNKSIYADKDILFNVLLGYEVDYLDYSYNDSNGREKKVKLCGDCSFHNKSKSFKDGKYNITIGAIDNDSIIESKKVSFIVDATAPKISKTLPKANSYTNGSGFYIQYSEDNVKKISVNYNLTVVLKSCNSSGKNQECYFNLSLKSYNGKEIEYFFTIEDIAGNKAVSKSIKIIVDTTSPSLNNPKTFWKQGAGRDNKYVYFNFNVTEKNFDQIIYSYIDSRGRLKYGKLCSKLKEGICETKKSFGIGENNLTIQIKDKAGNSWQGKISFKVV